MLGTDRDNEQLRNHLRQLQEQTTTIIRDASATIKSVSLVLSFKREYSHLISQNVFKHFRLRIVYRCCFGWVSSNSLWQSRARALEARLRRDAFKSISFKRISKQRCRSSKFAPRYLQVALTIHTLTSPLLGLANLFQAFDARVASDTGLLLC
jgi:hypothetical protein